MFIDVRGGTKSQRDTVAEAAYFAKSYLMPKIQKLYVEIVLRKMDSDADMLQGDDDRECVGTGIVEVAEYEENGDEYFWEMECEFCFGTGYEGGMN